MSNKPSQRDLVKQAVQETIAEKGGAFSTPSSLQFTVKQEMMNSPFPAPAILKAYNEVVPNGAERIMKIAEREQKHVHRLQYLSVALTWSGEAFAFLVMAGALGGSFWFLSKGQHFAGGTAFITAVGIMLLGYYERRKFQAAQIEQAKAQQQAANPQITQPNK